MKRLLFLLLLLLGACAQRGTLYDDLGGETGLQALTDELLLNFARDERVREQFRHTEMRRFKQLFVEHLCELSDGPCRYRGASMREAHAHLVIEEALFNAVVEHLQAAMDTRGYPQPTQNRLLQRLAPLREEILSDGQPLPSEVVE